MEIGETYLQLGQNIVSANDPLKRITPQELFNTIAKPQQGLLSKINQLRTVLVLDKKRYQALKKMLPYVTCGVFNPQYRRTENFASISCFMVDIDHLSQKNIDIHELKSRLKRDDSIHLMFTSPSNDGLKLLFLLKQKCFDHAKYSIFYKVFIAQFSTKHNLAQVVDRVTSDVTRACFLSVDEDAWFNPFASTVDMDAYVDFNNERELHSLQQKAEQTLQKPVDEKDGAEIIDKQALPVDVLQQIKEKLNPNVRLRREKQIVVPEELVEAEKTVKERMEELGIEVKKVESINYGKKFVFSLEHRTAQLNLHYGQKGFKIVRQPINGADPELTDVSYQVLCQIFY